MENLRSWVRLEDWINLAAGVYMVLVPVFYATVYAASANAFIMGSVIGVIALLALAYPRIRSIEWLQLLAGIWLFIGPWALGFDNVTQSAWNHWIVGAVVVILSAARLIELGGHYFGTGGTHLPHAA